MATNTDDDTQPTIETDETQGLSRRTFLKTTGALGATMLVGCGDDTNSGDADMGDTGDLADSTDATDMVDMAEVDTADLSDMGDADMVEEIDYPRGDPPVYDASPVAPEDPSTVDAAQPLTFDPAAVPLDPIMFAYGVSSGGMTQDSVLLWSHTTDMGPLKFRVWRESVNPGEILLVHDLDVTADASQYVRAEATNLAAGTWYHYGLFQLDMGGTAVKRSDLGRFRTAFLEDGVAPLIVGASTCTNYRNVPWTSAGRLAESGMDVFLHLGDFVYADGSLTPDDYRFHYLRAHGEANMRDALGAAGLYVTWDDHEFDNNLNPETLGDMRLEMAKAAFFENLPARRGTNGELWRSYRWGRTAEFFVMDSRSERRPSTRESADPVYLSREQMDWLKQGLTDSPCRFKILLNSVPVVNLFGAAADILFEDRWQGYQVPRKELLDHIYTDNIRDVWFISGDFHMGFITRLDLDGVGGKLWDLSVGPGGNGPNPMATTVESGLLYEEDVFPPEMYEYWSSNIKVATTLAFDPVSGNVAIQYVDGDSGELLYDGTLNQLGRA